MLNFFGLRKDSKKSLSSSSESESDGFVIVGETSEEQNQRMKSRSMVQPSTNVIVQPAKLPMPASPIKPPESIQSSLMLQTSKPAEEPPNVDAPSALQELLGDVPFTLAPHILAMQGVLPRLPDFTLPQDIGENLANFCYDFTLENSVLREP